MDKDHELWVVDQRLDIFVMDWGSEIADCLITDCRSQIVDQ